MKRALILDFVEILIPIRRIRGYFMRSLYGRLTMDNTYQLPGVAVNNIIGHAVTTVHPAETREATAASLAAVRGAFDAGKDRTPLLAVLTAAKSIIS